MTTPTPDQAAVTSARWPDGPLPRIERGSEFDANHPVFFHDCDGTVRRTLLPLSPETGWWWEADATLAPSIHCHACGTHGWWREGKWQQA